MSEKTAILFFHRAESEEKKHKSFRASVVTFLNSRTRKLISRSGLPVFDHIDFTIENISLQERFYLAVNSTFEKGFEHVIVVGNDCPQLQLGDIQKASAQLEVNDLVIGPDWRGGTYLLGISRNIFTKEWALSLPWHTNRFAEVASAGIENVCYMDKLIDFNYSTELPSIKKIKFRRSLLQAFIQLFICFENSVFKIIDSSISVIELKQLRAPPAHLHL